MLFVSHHNDSIAPSLCKLRNFLSLFVQNFGKLLLLMEAQSVVRQSPASLSLCTAPSALCRKRAEATRIRAVILMHFFLLRNAHYKSIICFRYLLLLYRESRLCPSGLVSESMLGLSSAFFGQSKTDIQVTVVFLVAISLFIVRILLILFGLFLAFECPRFM